MKSKNQPDKYPSWSLLPHWESFLSFLWSSCIGSSSSGIPGGLDGLDVATVLSCGQDFFGCRQNHGWWDSDVDCRWHWDVRTGQCLGFGWKLGGTCVGVVGCNGRRGGIVHGGFSTSSYLHFFITRAIGLHSISSGTPIMSSKSDLTICGFFCWDTMMICLQLSERCSALKQK